MEKRATSIYGPVYQMILQMQDAPDEELRRLMDDLAALNEETYSAFRSYDEEFDRIREENVELEEKLRNLNALLDKRMAEASPMDLAVSRFSCEKIYEGYWQKLDEFSQGYLTMANYLYNLFLEEDTDYSPSVLEFGRSLENELVNKIYDGYVQSLNGQTDGMTDEGSRYGELKSAVNAYANNGKYYIPARIMVRYLKYLSDGGIANDYNDALKAYLESNGVDKEIVSEGSFVTTSDELFDKYRNSAAHPGSTMDADEARRCREKTKKVLKKFMSAIP